MDISNDNDGRPQSTSHTTNHCIVVDSSITTQKGFDQVFIPTKYEKQTPMILLQRMRQYVRHKCVPSKPCYQSYIKILCPFISWLKSYKLDWLSSDIICGITVIIYHDDKSNFIRLFY